MNASHVGTPVSRRSAPVRLIRWAVEGEDRVPICTIVSGRGLPHIIGLSDLVSIGVTELCQGVIATMVSETLFKEYSISKDVFCGERRPWNSFGFSQDFEV